MSSGLNQEVNVLGRAFHFQTELSHQGGLSIRTEVFVGGKVVATRERRLDHVDRSAVKDEDLRALMKEHHAQVIERTLERVIQDSSMTTDRSTGTRPHGPTIDGTSTSVHLIAQTSTT